MQVVSATHPDEGLACLRKQSPSLVILDLMLPGRDGLAVCREIRHESSVPIILLTARGDLPDRVAGLELGADDYLSKPFEPRELVARIQTVLRRSGETRAPGLSRERFRADALIVDLRSRTAWLDGTGLDLTTTDLKSWHYFFTIPARS